MRELLTKIGCIVGAAGAIAGVFGASYDWPDYFAVPARDTADTGRYRQSDTLRYYEEVLDMNDRSEFRRADSSSRSYQTISHDISIDVRDTVAIQTLDLSGFWMRDHVLLPGVSAGLEWDPKMFLRHQTNNNGLFQTTVDVGPAVTAPVFDIPVKVHGGLTGSGWCDSMYSDLPATRWADVHGASGYWAGAAIGRPDQKLFGLPLYGEASGVGRVVQQSGFGIAMGGLRFAGGLPSADSIFAYYGDSIANGNQAALNEGTQGNLRYDESTPWHISRSMQVSAGIKGAPRLHLIPAILYSYSQNSTIYPTDLAGLQDSKDALQAVNLMVSTDTALFFDYHGGLRLEFENVDKLAGHRVSSSLSGAPDDSLIRDSLVRESEGFAGFAAIMDHQLIIKFPGGWRGEYDFSISRHSLTYPTLVVKGPSGDVTFSTHDDNDRIITTHDVSLTTDTARRVAGSLGFRYSEQVINNLDSTQSRSNQTLDNYEVRGTMSWKPVAALQCNELAIGSASVQSFQYDRWPYVPNPDQPDYSRHLSSVLSGQWLISDHYTLKGQWTEAYWDDGQWYGKQYFAPDTADSIAHSYYAIQTYSLEWDLAFSLLTTALKGWEIEIGGKIGDVNQHLYRNNSYLPDNDKIGYDLEPWMRIAWRPGDGAYGFRGYVKRIFGTNDESRWNVVKNWEVRLDMQVKL